MKNALLLSLALIAVGPVAVEGQEVSLSAALARCTAIESALERLDCFDSLAREEGASANAKSSPQLADSPSFSSSPSVGSWQISEDTNPLDDSKTVSAILMASEGRNSRGQAPALVVRCGSGDIDVYINWRDYMGSGPTSVTTRIGIEDAETRGWSLSTDNTATFARNGRAFMQRLSGAGRLVAQATPYNESPVTAVFDLTGISEVIVGVWQACP